MAAGIRRVKGVRRQGVRLGNWLTPEQGRRLISRIMSDALSSEMTTLAEKIRKVATLSGGAILDAVSLLEADGLRPEAALCVIDRGAGGGEALARIGLPLKALLPL